MSHLIRLSMPKTPYPAAGTVDPPVAFVDAAVIAKRSGELISAITASLGKIVIARKFQADSV
jgi:hypothetical protein